MSQAPIQTGHRIGNETLTWIHPNEHISPLRDNLLIEPLPLDLGTSLDVVYQGKPVRGRVVAAGPGHYPKRYNGPKGYRSKTWNATRFQPTEVKVGDIVDIGGLELGGYLFQTLRWGDKDLILCREADVT